MELDMTKNFNLIFNAVSNKGIKRTAFAKSMGYSSTSQLAATLEGEALISTKAIIELIKNFNVNPTFLFTGQGEMFLAEGSEIENLKKENREWIQRNNEAVKTVMELNEIIKNLEKRNSDLIDMSAAAIKYHKEQKPDIEVDLDKERDINKRLIKILKYHGLIKYEDDEINITELERSLNTK
jgi:hypothetical protein